MALTEDEIEILRESLHQLQEHRQLAASVFYENLFVLDPSLRPMFDEDLTEQSNKALFAFGAVVAQIHDIEACRDMTKDLALRHLKYGVTPDHYALVGQAVLMTVSTVMGPAMTRDIEKAWQHAYDQVASAMIESAYPAQSPMRFGR